MTCDSCGNKEAHRLSFSFSKKSRSSACDRCSRNSSSFKFSDVYFRKPHFEEHLADADKFPKGIFINSREQKAAIMRQLGVSETGDSKHGAR